MSVEGNTARATWFGGWVQVAMLVLSLVIAIGGAVVLSEVRAARSDSANAALEQLSRDHESRLRRLEDLGLRMEGKIDRQGDKIEAISRAVGAKR